MNIRKSMYRLVIALSVVPFLIFSLLLTFTYNTELKKVVQESLEAVANSQPAEMVDFCEQCYALSEINLDFYDNIRKRAKLWNESTFYLLDGGQSIISAGTQEHKRESFVTIYAERKDYQEKYNTIDFAAHPQGSFIYRVDGNSYITYYSNVEYTD